MIFETIRFGILLSDQFCVFKLGEVLLQIPETKPARDGQRGEGEHEGQANRLEDE